MIEEPFHRLKAARKNKRFEKATDAARAYGWNLTTYRSHENGTRNFTTADAQKYGKVFNVSAGWLIFGENPPDWYSGAKSSFIHRHDTIPMRKIPIVNYNQLVQFFEDKINYSDLMAENNLIDIPADQFHNVKCIALPIEFETSISRIRKSDLLVIAPNYEWKAGDYIIAKISDHRPEIMQAYNQVNDQGHPSIYLKNIKIGYEPFEMSKAKVEPLGKVIYRIEMM